MTIFSLHSRFYLTFQWDLFCLDLDKEYKIKTLKKKDKIHLTVCSMVYLSDSIFETEKWVGFSLLFSCKLIFSLRYFNPELPSCQVLLNQHNRYFIELGWEKKNNDFNCKY